MAQTTSTHNLPYPEGTDTPDVPRDIKALAEATDRELEKKPNLERIFPGTKPTVGSNFKIEVGRIGVTVKGGNSGGSTNITFANAFASAPILSLTVESPAFNHEDANYYGVAIAPTTTGVGLGAYRRSGTAPADEGVWVHYIAVGF
jgi:hypothetical protein